MAAFYIVAKQKLTVLYPTLYYCASVRVYMHNVYNMQKYR